MRRSIFGFEDWLYGVLALVLAVFHQPGLIVVLLIFLVVAERDGWLNRQVTQALLLYFGCALGAMLLRMVFSALLVLPFFGWLAYSGLSGLSGIGMELAMILFALRAADRMRKGLDSDIPFASGLAEMIF